MTPKEHQQLLERIASSLERIEVLLTSQGNQTVEGSVGIQKGFRTPPQDADIVVQMKSSSVEEFLSSKGIIIKAKKPEDPADGIIDSLSLFLGERYPALRILLAKIKRSMQTGAAFTEGISNISQEDINSICQFCSRLHSIAFLEQYKYFRSPQYLIRAKTTTLPKAQMFFGGQWLERFTLQKLQQAHAIVQTEYGDNLPFEYLINPQVILPNGDDFELDIIAMVAGVPLWVEAKSGDYQQHVQKYSKLARLMGLDYSHSVMVLTDVNDAQCSALSSLFSMDVANLSTFETCVLKTLRKDLKIQGAGGNSGQAAVPQL